MIMIMIIIMIMIMIMIVIEPAEPEPPPAHIEEIWIPRGVLGKDFCHLFRFLGKNSQKKGGDLKKRVSNSKMDRKSVDRKSFLDLILDTKFDEKLQKLSFEKSPKKQPSQKFFFWYSLPFSDGKSSDFNVFCVDFESPRALFSDVFLGFRFGLKFEAFSAKNMIKTETRKVAFIS